MGYQKAKPVLFVFGLMHNIFKQWIDQYEEAQNYLYKEESERLASDCGP